MHEQATRPGGVLAIFILGALFFLFGFVTWLNGALIPYLRIACELSTFQAMLVAFAFYIAYAVMALPSAWLLRRIGLKNGMTAGLLVMALGTLIFLPAAMLRTYGLFLGGLFVIGTGLAILQTASNPYITILGPMESAARRISIMGVCNKVAGMLAPLVLGALVLADADALTAELQVLDGSARIHRLDELANRAVLPYAMLTVFLVALGLLLRWSPLPDIEPPEEDAPDAIGKGHALAYPNLGLGVLALFLYVGVEVIAGDTIGTYGQEQGLPLSVAKHLTSYTLGAMVVGYLLGIMAIPRFIGQATALAISALLGILFSMCALFSDGMLSVSFIALLGLANALVWPAIWPLAIAGLGRHTKEGAAYLIMAIAGGALLPLVYGGLADVAEIGPQRAYWLLLPCYTYMAWYALRGHRLRYWVGRG